MIPLAPLFLDTWLERGGNREVLSASRGMAGRGGTYAGYFEVIS